MRWYVWKLWRFAWLFDGNGDWLADGPAIWRRLCGRLWIRNGSSMHVCLEVKPADVWVGVAWRREWEYPQSFREAVNARAMLKLTGNPKLARMIPRLDVWVCLLPCLPIHLMWWGEAKDWKSSETADKQEQE